MIPRALMLNDFGALTVVQSEMYFLYTLWAFATLNYAWAQYGHYYKATFELLYVKVGQNVYGGAGGESGTSYLVASIYFYLNLSIHPSILL